MRPPTLAFLALSAASLPACATYPKHTEPDPLGPPRTHAPTAAAAVRLVVAPLSRVERCGSHYYYRLALRPSDLPGHVSLHGAKDDAHAVVLGDVRSPNVDLTSAQADAIERGWWRPTDWPPSSAFDCSARLSEYARSIEDEAIDDAHETLGLIEGALDDMRVRAAAGGADAIDDVRCYVVANTLNVTPRRLWCEGVAVRD